MNWNEIKDNWKHVSDKIKLTWGKLSEDDLTEIAGDHGQLASFLQEKYGYEKVDAENKADQFAQGLNPQFVITTGIDS